MESRDSELYEALPWAGEGATWATKTPDEILADLRAAFNASFNDAMRPVPVMVYDKLTGKIRAATSEDFDDCKAKTWMIAKAPLAASIVERLEANEAEVRRVMPRVIRNQSKHHPIKAFRRPW